MRSCRKKNSEEGRRGEKMRIGRKKKEEEGEEEGKEGEEEGGEEGTVVGIFCTYCQHPTWTRGSMT